MTKSRNNLGDKTFDFPMCLGIVLRSGDKLYLQVIANWLEERRPDLQTVINQDIERNSEVLHPVIAGDSPDRGWCLFRRPAGFRELRKTFQRHPDKLVPSFRLCRGLYDVDSISL